ncbi:5490_t:CDS:2 [Gigaspora margarita]|uniref:5490_t:CDS:1 n=1 Tax=Gigaspora margarita TaxID=4874 RepID=A0ABN7VSP1_GIGMA|nr:5490_t:CDS:2 [Gigaspora margarita]
MSIQVPFPQYHVNDDESISLPFVKSTNRLDDILELTDKGHERVAKIKQGLALDLIVWWWVLFCDSSNSCQRACGRIGECLQKCSNYSLKNYLKNDFDTHKSVPETKLKRINLSLQARDKAIAAYEIAYKESGESSKTNMLSDSTQYFQNYSSINDNDIEVEYSDISSNMNTLESSVNIPYSIYHHNTTRFRNKHECNWNPKEFTSAAVVKRLCLDNDPVENGVKLYRWISNRKTQAKNA